MKISNKLHACVNNSQTVQRKGKRHLRKCVAAVYLYFLPSMWQPAL